MNICRSFSSLLIILIVSQFPGLAQEISIHLGPDKIGTNQAFTITITVENEILRSYDEFPEIPGFVKRGTSSSSSTNFINGQVSSSQSITQNYLPTNEGTYNLQPFVMTINDQRIRSKGKKIEVSSPVQSRRQQDPFTDPFGDFFGQKQKQEYVDVDADAFLALTTDKNDVYQGEGFTVTLAFYVAEANRAQMQFYELGKQLTEIVKKLKPANCWEENFNIENISQELVTLNGEKYNRYKIFQAAYFPLNNETIDFPPVDLELIKYKVAKRRTFFGQSKVEDYETFTSRHKSITIKDLPPHPLKSKVPVGIYELQEQISGQQLRTGQSFNYSFIVKGDGNISAIDNPFLKEDGDIDLYPPNIRQNITRGSGRVKGLKTFSYFGVPNEPGEYGLADYFWLPYFDPQREVYDTLKSELTVYITGESKKNEMIQANDLGSFYDLMQLENNELKSFSDSKYIKIIGNIFILLMLILSAVFIFKK